jgi:hypothetical protein
MGHCIQAIIGRPDTLAIVLERFQMAQIVSLTQGFAMVPATEALLDAIYARTHRGTDRPPLVSPISRPAWRTFWRSSRGADPLPSSRRITTVDRAGRLRPPTWTAGVHSSSPNRRRSQTRSTTRSG